MGKLGVLFAGQGSQYPGMGLDWLAEHPDLVKHLAETNSILGTELTTLLTSAQGQLDQTIHAQPAIVATSLFAYESLRKATHFAPTAFAGFSLGEYSALEASGIYSFPVVIHLVRERAKAMQACATAHPGAMSAVLGLSAETIQSVCNEASHTGSIVVPANYNCPGQIVISGDKEAIVMAHDLARLAGAKRCVPLNVSGAFHSPLMKPAAQTLETILATYHPDTPVAPVYANVTALPYVSGEIRSTLVKQITSPVRFDQTIRQMIASGITHFLEIGPGQVLSGFVRKIDDSVQVMNLDKADQLEKVKGWLHEHGFSE